MEQRVGGTPTFADPNGMGGGAFCYYPAGAKVAPGVISECIIIGDSAGLQEVVYSKEHFTTHNDRQSASGFGSGGGANGSILNSCLIIGNTDATGGGAGGGTLNNCLIASNSASFTGGGALGGSLNNSTIVGNTIASGGGGVKDSTVKNCVIYYNNAPSQANYYFQYAGGLNYCCTTPLPNGVGNITNAPAFVNLSSGDFHLQPNSPCINPRQKFLCATPTDLDGNPRIVGGTVDIGAYEFQSPTSIISYAWAAAIWPATDGTADYLPTPTATA